MEHGELSPFLKWAGGKRWLTRGYPELFPEKCNRYIEPFLGSGAVFFQLLPKNSILADKNKELIDTYKAIKDNQKLVQRYLAKHHKNHSKDYYYKIRSSATRSIYSRAARFIYLNRTCWNALYRVNLNGQFNVPIGSKTSVLLSSDNFESTAGALKRAKLMHSDFESIINKSREGDFLFVDPPYTVKHNLNGFVKYNEKIFSWDDQIRLRDSLVSASNRGAQILLTNADHESIREIYKNVFNLERLERKSVIAASSIHRIKTSELIFSNYL
ncbi:MAG: Dam family site-specific DNA-(adenine-N6)-methyltransferase [Gammaproteobacteria bacterium]|nr:Dam family site-specific DNA-(adenine-N6)-methyltransferase [Gammaproteobacteria bacterium]